MRNSYSLRRYIYVSALFLGVCGLLWAVILSRGILGGYFALFPTVPTFFFLMGILAVHYMHKIIDGGQRNRMVVHFMLLTMGRLLIDVLFVVLGLLLLENTHRMGFVVVALSCYLLSLLLSVRYII